MRIRDYYNSILANPRRGHPRYEEARRDYTDALRARLTV